MFAPVLFKEWGRCAGLTLNNPDRGNALSAEIVRAAREKLQDIFSNGSYDTLVVTGAGRNFCTGFDLGGIEQQSDGDLLARFVQIEMLLSDLWQAPIRTVAFAKGRTWGAGADIFAACDYRVAQAGTTFRFPGAGFGIVLGTRRLCERVGDSVARRWVTTNAEISADEAREQNLVTDGDESGEVDEWLATKLPKLTVQRGTIERLYRASRKDNADADLAHLVRSAAEPGLRDRIVSYANAGRSKKEKPSDKGQAQ